MILVYYERDCHREQLIENAKLCYYTSRSDDNCLIAYLLSIPERLFRALAAGAGGVILEAAELLLPRFVRRSRLYQAVIYRLLRLTVEWVGGVHNVLPPDEVSPSQLAMRKAAGNVIELASFAAVGWSPLWLLAAAADLSGGTRIYLNALTGEFERSGLLPEGIDVSSVDGLLAALEDSSSRMADMVDVPPLNIQELQTSWKSLQANAKSLPDANRLARLYETLLAVSRQQGRSIGATSTLLAAGAVRAGLQMGNQYIFDYYSEALNTLKEEGWLAYARRVARPYLLSAKGHFSRDRTSYTERFLSRGRHA